MKIDYNKSHLCEVSTHLFLAKDNLLNFCGRQSSFLSESSAALRSVNYRKQKLKM